MRMIAGAIVFHAGVTALSGPPSPGWIFFGWLVVAAGGYMILMALPERPERPDPPPPVT